MDDKGLSNDNKVGLTSDNQSVQFTTLIGKMKIKTVIISINVLKASNKSHTHTW